MADRSIYSRIGRLSAIITILPATMAAGFVFGYFVIDRWLQIFPWGTIVFLLLGAGTGFYEIFRILVSDRDKSKVGGN